MKDIEKICRVALVQAEPVMFDKKASLEKALKYIEEASKKDPDLIVFPELFIPGYPIGMNFGFSMGKRSEGGRKDWLRYYKASLVEGGEEFQRLIESSKKSGAYISLGFSERDRVSEPTGSERVVWGDANKNYFPITETAFGPIGSLICWESYMPLARVALYEKGITIYISPNTNDNPEWQATIQHIAIEGKCFFINADMIVRSSSYPSDLNESEALKDLPSLVCRGGSCIIDPYGHYVTEPIWDREEIIYADLDMTLVAACKMEHDAVGHYARPDVLELRVNDK